VGCEVALFSAAEPQPNVEKHADGRLLTMDRRPRTADRNVRAADNSELKFARIKKKLDCFLTGAVKGQSLVQTVPQ